MLSCNYSLYVQNYKFSAVVEFTFSDSHASNITLRLFCWTRDVLLERWQLRYISDACTNLLKPAAAKGQSLAILVSFTADMLSGAENNTEHSSISSSSLKTYK